jgi:hypothetical protein
MTPALRSETELAAKPHWFGAIVLRGGRVALSILNATKVAVA